MRYLFYNGGVITKPCRDEIEIAIFQDFALKASLPVDSFENRPPPEPDILCWLKTGQAIAFELVELCHPVNAAFWGRCILLSRLIEEAYSGLTNDLKPRFDSRFAGKPLSFDFRAGATTNKIRNSIPGVLAELVSQPETEDIYRAFSPVIRDVLVSVAVRGRVYDQNQPAFNIAGSFQQGDVTPETIKSKLNKVYVTRHPVELVAYFGTHAWEKSFSCENLLREVLGPGGLGPFRRIWIVGSSQVLFVYPSG